MTRRLPLLCPERVGDRELHAHESGASVIGFVDQRIGSFGIDVSVHQAVEMNIDLSHRALARSALALVQQHEAILDGDVDVVVALRYASENSDLPLFSRRRERREQRRNSGLPIRCERRFVGATGEQRRGCDDGERLSE